MTIEIIKKRLKEEIVSTGKTQTWIAEQLKINQSNISDYVNGKQVPKIDTFAEICKLLDLNANYILGIEDYSGKKNTEK